MHPAANRSTSFAEELVDTIDRFSSLVRADMLGSGVTSAQGRILAALRSQGPQRITDLAEFEYVSQPAMSSLVASLERAGMVERQPSSDDGRVVMVGLTPHGEEVIRALRASRTGVVVSSLANLDDRDQKALASLGAALDQLARLMREGQSADRRGGSTAD